jgi:hypothetical protein
MKATIVSAANEAYFPLLKGLILSIFDRRPDDAIALSVVNVGLAPNQIVELQSMGVTVAEGVWHFPFAQQATSPRWFQTMTGRCKLREYFPGHDLYLWLDADVWLQDWRAIELLIAAASDADLAIVPEIHRAYSYLYKMGPFKENQLLEFFAASVGAEQALRLASQPVMNSGVLAIRNDSRAWDVWEKWMKKSLAGTIHKMSEQCALSGAIYLEGLSAYALPAWCNWMCCQAFPMYDSKSRRFVEPVLPFEPISILHLTQRHKGVWPVKTISGEIVELPLDYSSYRDHGSRNS